MSEIELNISVSRKIKDDADYQEVLGKLLLLDDRLYIEDDLGVSLGIDLYTVIELLKRRSEP